MGLASMCFRDLGLWGLPYQEFDNNNNNNNNDKHLNPVHPALRFTCVYEASNKLIVVPGCTCIT